METLTRPQITTGICIVLIPFLIALGILLGTHLAGLWPTWAIELELVVKSWLPR